MNRITCCCLIMFASTAAVSLAEDPADDKKAAIEQLTGTYRITGGERNGQPIEEDRLAEITVQIAANAITTLDKDKNEVYAATYELDTTKNPWRIKMTSTLAPDGSKETVAEGLISIEEKTVKLIYALPGGQTPTSFKTEAQQQLFALERTAK